MEISHRANAAIVCSASPMFSASEARTFPWSRNASIVAGGHRIHRVGTDQFLHVEHVAVRGILGSRARPKQPLHVRAFGPQLLPTGAGEQTLVASVRELCVRDGDLAAQSGSVSHARSASFVQRSRSSISPSTATSIRLTKKLATLATSARIAALRDQMFEAGQIGFDDLFIDLL